MAKTIVQKVVFKNTTPESLYNLYMDSKLHSLMCGGPVKITNKEGAAFSAHGGYITGKNLHLVKNESITQTWRAVDWSKKEADSIFIMKFEKKGKDTILHAVHANVPDKSAKNLDKGWHDHYWTPWKQYLAGKEVKRPTM